MTSPHDRYCPVPFVQDDDCQFCTDLRAARAEERGILQESWQATLRDIELREYTRGWQDGTNGKPACP